MKMETEPKPELTHSSGTLAETVTRAAAAQQSEVPGLGTVTAIRREIDDALADMRMFHKVEPDQVMQAVSAHSARLVEIVVHIQRIEVVRREWKPVREEAERVLAEMKSQFSVASRLLAMRQVDWEMSTRGQA